MVNKVILVGRLGSEPSVRAVGSSNVCSFNLATSERWKDKSGEQKEVTEWHSIEIWDKLADIASKYLKKGSMVYLEGKIRTEKYEKDGQTKYSVKIRVSEMKMLDMPKSDSSNESNDEPTDAKPKNVGEDDLPF